MSTDVVPAAGHRRRRLPGWAVPVLVLLVAVLALGGWVGYVFVGTNLVGQYRSLSEKTRLRAAWQQASPSPSADSSVPPSGPPTARPTAPAAGATAGGPLALLRIPAFGPGYEVPVLSGTGLDVLGRGVGHYSATALPGQVGNFAVAGHRATSGQPFAKLLELRRGDRVVVETRTAVYTYVLDVAPRDLTVQPSAGWVLDPVPGKPRSTPTEALLTLTTEQDLVRTPDRSVGIGHLASTQNKG